MIKIRPAVKPEMQWINKCYDVVEFVHSSYEKEIIAIAEYAGEKAGLGRLVTLDDKNLELGGMYVFDSYRGKGIARAIVEFLLNQVPPSKKVYCIPFGHLAAFYEQFGFAPCHDFREIPEELVEKFRWCKKKYPQETLLLSRPSASFS